MGEGPGAPVAHGEQYLGAQGALERDGELLAAIRPWMTLDSEPADHLRLEDRLEGWSCFGYRNLQLVARLTSAGYFDRRAAYFTHGRAWQLDGLARGVDPGLHLGRSEAFEAPWRDDDAGERVAEPAPALVRPEQIAAEPSVAALFLGHYLQALVGRYPLIIAVPVSDFLAGAPVHALVSFSRGALPADLRINARIRIYSRLPELFLKHLQANLVVVPEEVAGDALGVRRGATLLDRQGVKRAGRDLEPAALAYSEAVVERAIRIPEGLAWFSERFGERRAKPGLPAEREVRTVQIAYNLAYALSGSEGQRADLLRSYLPKAAQRYGPGCDWQFLLDREEWRAFPREALLDLVLLDSAALDPGTRELQVAVEAAVAGFGLSVDGRLDAWWNPAEPWKLRRLLELLEHEPPLVSGPAAGQRTGSLPIERIAAAGPAGAFLASELEQGTIAVRSRESGALGRLAADPRVFDTLGRAVSAGRLDSGWAIAYVKSAQDEALAEALRRFHQIPGFWTGWEEVPGLLLDRLRASGSEPGALGPLILSAAREVDPLRQLGVYLRLADLLARIDEVSGTAGENVLLQGLWRALPGISRPADRELLVNAALGGEWRCLHPQSLLQGEGLRAPWLAEMADRLLAEEEIASRLAAPALLELGAKLQEAGSFERLYARLDARMMAAREQTTGALVRGGWWQFWRRCSALREDDLREAAMAWMTADAWQEKGLEATREAWQQAVADLPQDLSGTEMASLCKRRNGSAVPGPAIPPFEQDQLLDLSHRAADLGALAELADAVRADRRFAWLEAPHPLLLQGSRFSKLSSDTVAWLMETRVLPQPRPLGLEDSALLYRHCGHRAPRALAARVRSVVEALAERPGDALAAAAEPDLWDQPEFLAALAEWMARRGSIAAMGRDNAALIDQEVRGAPARYPAAVPRDLMRGLLASEWTKAANLLSPARATEEQQQSLIDAVIGALGTGADGDRCWGALAAEIGQASAPGRRAAARHPVARLAEEIRGRRELSREERRTLAERGWDTFDRASRAYPKLVAFMPQEDAILPAFELAASMAGPGAAGNAALRVIFGAAGDGGRSSVPWWQALLRGLRGDRRAGGPRGMEDREEVSVALIAQWIGELDGMEQQTFWRALEKEAAADSGWDLPADLGAASP